MNSDTQLPKMTKVTLFRVLKDLNFVFAKRKRDSALIEREDIIAWRHRYLRAMRQFRRDNRMIYYLDETWINAGNTTQQVWQDSTVTC